MTAQDRSPWLPSYPYRWCWKCGVCLQYGAMLCIDCLTMILAGLIVGFLLAYFGF